PQNHSDPAADGSSRLSPYLHFGQLSPLEIAHRIVRADAPRESRDAFIEQLIVRRELSLNFVLQNPSYDRWEGLPAWARKTLEERIDDVRNPVYDETDLEAARTHDPYWNAAQMEMVRTGFMHNTMRMYWGKKILEWSRSPQEAFRIALRLNNVYELDGRDPNGYAGVAWCFGKHDRPWTRRPIFGTVRYMNAQGLRRKYDIERYVERVRAAGIES
ncbi:MAG: deoxyribodipyrimidine photolyase, partial [Kiritimatiellia bacterium]|nr:deoxyribodipyrimidine photolyase [Kiritimatiellia bacterium]